MVLGSAAYLLALFVEDWYRNRDSFLADHGVCLDRALVTHTRAFQHHCV
jgi:hypothetical protein